MGRHYARDAMKWDVSLEYKYGKLIGIDEVGRGCLAGPVVSCAVVMPSNSFIQGVRDSKRLSSKKREQLSRLIRLTAIGIGYGIAEPEEIDRIGIRPAVQLTMRRAVESLVESCRMPCHIACDYETVPLPIPQTAVIHGDDTMYPIACASILAKVYRDRMAAAWDAQYPGYALGQNKGYGTAQHRAGIDRLGLTPLHRRSFCKAWSFE
ncbi:MAG: ribonuclease HII [Peptoniphilaceae bacterium]|mgnify:FL=1|jgi:ribonuclease HII